MLLLISIGKGTTLFWNAQKEGVCFSFFQEWGSETIGRF